MLKRHPDLIDKVYDVLKVDFDMHKSAKENQWRETYPTRYKMEEFFAENWSIFRGSKD